jgi:predicted nicotinamide N-methyase
VSAPRSGTQPSAARLGHADLAAFVRAQTRLAAPPLIPEITLWLSHDEPTVLWERLEQASGRSDLPPPFWAYPWTGGIALARYLLDHPGQVAGQTVLDLASGSGLVAIVAARLGAAAVTASDIDPVAATAIALNAQANDVTLTITTTDLLTAAPASNNNRSDHISPSCHKDHSSHTGLVLVGDAFYERRMAHRALAFLRGLRDGGARVLIGDPGRAYLPEGLRQLARYDVPAWAGLEDTEIKPATVWELP